MNFLDKEGLVYLWSKIKSYVTSKIPTNTSQLTNDSGFVTSSDVVTIKKITQEEYDALETKDETILYLTPEEE